MATTRLTSKELRARAKERQRSTATRAKPNKDGRAPRPEVYATGSNAPTTGELNLEISIGRRVRLLRQRLQLTATELAAEAGLSPGMLSKIENGGTSPSLSTLRALARALNVPMTSFFADFEERRDCSYVVAGQGVLIERRGSKAGHRYELLGHSISGDIVVEPYLITLSEDAEPYAQFQHDGVEFIYMLSGKVIYRHADKLYPMAPGDALFFDAGAPHGPEELIKRPMTYLSIIIYPRP
ncbi:MAG: helix-turn-helix domain-containing protein [Methyloceanibacter sp.]|uniref:helix-turn-helix domain-containing protein n=1 Tax=Methyloceanibacter sp. TaxID=1965321 RepID=UPI003D6C891E